MTELIEELERIASAAEQHAHDFEAHRDRITKGVCACKRLSRYSPNIWTEEFAQIYPVDLEERTEGPPGQLEGAYDPWEDESCCGRKYSASELYDIAISGSIGAEGMDGLNAAASIARTQFTNLKQEALPILHVLAEAQPKTQLTRLCANLSELNENTKRHVFEARLERETARSTFRGEFVLDRGDRSVPPHISLEVHFLQIGSHAGSLRNLAACALEAARYCRWKLKKQPQYRETRPEPYPRRIFIGHGRSDAWRALKDFLERLGLEVEEFNRESQAGRSTKERLEEMLGRSGFAFIVMTGEDRTNYEEVRARQNVIHEAGLFQGRLGFTRAIILLEDGCEKFSNIDGLTYIGFKKSDIEGAFENVRRVLEREKVISTASAAHTSIPVGP